MDDEEEDRFIKENPIVFKKYKVKKKLGEGAFGDVYLGQTIENNKYVAIKVEPRKIVKPILESEAFLLYSIAGLGIPEVKSFGKVKNYNILVQPLLGKSLFDIFAENHKKMPVEDVCLIGKQIIERIQWVHSKYIVHRDIKPDNFLIGKRDPNVIYLIDFGLSKKYRSSTTNKHIRFGFTGKLTGTVRFASANALRGGEQSRRDDIESIGYMLVYFLKQKLPWQGVTGNKKMERYLKIYKLKKNTTPEELCGRQFPEMIEYISYAKKLEFEQEPDYNYLIKLFNNMLKRYHNTNDQLVFSWIKLADLPNLKNPINPATRRDSPQSRIYKKIKSNLEKERNLSSDSDAKTGVYQQASSQNNLTYANLKVVNANNYTGSEFEQKTDKKINKRLLKAKEGLNTTVANLDVTVDENVIDFENERIKKGSRDLGDYVAYSNNKGSNFNSNKEIDNILPEKINSNKILSNEKKSDFYRLKSKENKNNDIEDINRNLNFEFNSKDLIDNNKIKNSIKNNNDEYLNNLNKENNINPNNNTDLFPNDNIKIGSNKTLENKNISDINKNNKNNDLKKNLEDNKINNNINDIDNIFNEKNNDLIDFLENQNNNNKNNYMPQHNINNSISIKNKENNNINEAVNPNLKSINFDGTELTFSEPLDFNQNQDFNKLNQLNQNKKPTNNNSGKNGNKLNIKEKQKNNNKEKEKAEGNSNINIYSLITGSDQIINNLQNNNIDKQKEIEEKNNYMNNIDNNNDYLKLNNNNNSNMNDNNLINNSINKSVKNRNNINYILNERRAPIQNSEKSNSKQNQINNNMNNNESNNNNLNNNINYVNNKKRIMIKKVKRNTLNKKQIANPKNIKTINIMNNDLKNNSNIKRNNEQFIDKKANNSTFPNDNEFDNFHMQNSNLKKLLNSKNKNKINVNNNNNIQAKNNKTSGNDDFFNEFNNNLFDNNKKDNKNIIDFNNTDARKNSKNNRYNQFNIMYPENSNINKQYRGSNNNFSNNKMNLNYGYNKIKSFPQDNNNIQMKKKINNKINVSNNIKTKNNLNNKLSSGLSGQGSGEVNKNFSYNSNNINSLDKELQKMMYINNIYNKSNNVQDVNAGNIVNIKQNNYILKIGSNEIKNNSFKDANNARIGNLQKKIPSKMRNIEEYKKIGNLTPNINENQGFKNNSQSFSNKKKNINDNIKSKLFMSANTNYNNNLMIGNNNNQINNINNQQQINYQMAGFKNINNNNIQYLNNNTNYQPITIRPSLGNQKIISVAPPIIQTNLSKSLRGGGIQYINNPINNGNPLGNIQYNMITNNNMYIYPQTNKYQVSLK